MSSACRLEAKEQSGRRAVADGVRGWEPGGEAARWASVGGIGDLGGCGQVGEWIRLREIGL